MRGAGLNDKLRYPTTRTVDVVDDYHGTKVADPYRWLEDLESADTVAWVAEQNRLTEGYLSRQPMRSYFQERIQQLWNYPKTNLPLVEGGRLFYRRNSGLQMQAPLFVRDSLTSAPTLLIDPNALWPDGKTSLAAFEPAPDARHLAYAYAKGGADWQTIRIRNLVTSEDLEDEINWMRFSGLSWTKDGNGFFYARYPEPPAGKVLEAALSGHALYYHALGTPQTLDRLIYTNAENPSWFVGGVLTDDGRYLLVSTSKGADNNNRLYLVDLADPLEPAIDAALQPIFEEDDAELSLIGSHESTLFLRTDRDAPNRRIVSIDVRALVLRLDDGDPGIGARHRERHCRGWTPVRRVPRRRQEPPRDASTSPAASWVTWRCQQPDHCPASPAAKARTCCSMPSPHTSIRRRCSRTT